MSLLWGKEYIQKEIDWEKGPPVESKTHTGGYCHEEETSGGLKNQKRRKPAEGRQETSKEKN